MTAPILYCGTCCQPTGSDAWTCPRCLAEDRAPTDMSLNQAYDLNRPYVEALCEADALRRANFFAEHGRGLMGMGDGSVVEDTERTRAADALHVGERVGCAASTAPKYVERSE
jgi:hypothetical protein